MKILNYVQLKIKCICRKGMRIYLISSKTSDLKHIDVGKKRVHIYSCFKEKSNYFNREKRGIPHIEGEAPVIRM